MKISHSHLNTLWPWIILGLGFAAGLTVFTGALPRLRTWLVLAFLLWCPGMAFVRLLRTEDWIITATLAIALSLALNAMVALLLLYFWAWSPINGMMMILAISFLGVMFKTGEEP